MESTVSGTTLFTLSKSISSSHNLVVCSLHHHLSRTLSPSIQKRFSSGRIRCIYDGNFQRSSQFVPIYSPGTSLRNLHLAAPISSRMACISSSTASFASGGSGDDTNEGNGGGGGDSGDGSNNGETKSKSIGGDSEEVSTLSSDVIILHVGGMTCGGCAASVKRILESQINWKLSYFRWQPNYEYL
ncbi:PREDICTED: copper-transporting ATPase PAA1, chloroplastic-like isoform X2 [Nelumbo nucifera]|uniref:Copper-transporting ATPase PAA1, chloroplastic-like isoform X2 n=1 Tax=Nelumbo nucifera TaxID=4432 RepID=A0A1U8Q9L4_NELNU|nr:PREDICTED: copper-transporting ATPase PAA1, chloroplastic-like isoform X2 [Nelumbo nucifera]